MSSNQVPLSQSSDGSEALGLRYARAAEYYDEMFNVERKWAPRTAAVFVVVVSGLLWLGILLGVTWLLGAF